MSLSWDLDPQSVSMDSLVEDCSFEACLTLGHQLVVDVVHKEGNDALEQLSAESLRRSCSARGAPAPSWLGAQDFGGGVGLSPPCLLHVLIL